MSFKFFHLKGFGITRDYSKLSHNISWCILSKEEEFNKVLKDHAGMIWRVACSYERDKQLCLDLNQEILLAIWKALPKFKEQAKLKTFLARIAHNRCITHVTRETARPFNVELDESYHAKEPTPYEQAEANNRHDILLKTINKLPLAWRQVMTLSLEGFKPKEIASVLDENANAISIRLTRAKKALRHDLKELHDDK